MLNNNQQQNPVAVRGNPTPGTENSQGPGSGQGLPLNSNSSRRAIGIGQNGEPMNGFNLPSNTNSNPGLQTMSSIQ